MVSTVLPQKQRVPHLSTGSSLSKYRTILPVINFPRNVVPADPDQTLAQVLQDEQVVNLRCFNSSIECGGVQR